MRNVLSTKQTITVAERAHIIQRVLVDGWTIAQAANSHGLPKRVVEVWVADFRKNGMSSLRHQPGQTIAAEILRVLSTVLRRLGIGLRRSFAGEPVVQPLPLRRSNQDGPG
jgi:transposase-like protein